MFTHNEEATMSHPQRITFEQLIELINRYISSRTDIRKTTRIEDLTTNTDLLADVLNSRFGVNIYASDFLQLQTVNELLKMLNAN